MLPKEGNTRAGLKARRVLVLRTCPGIRWNDGAWPKAAPGPGSDGPLGPCIWHQELLLARDALRMQTEGSSQDHSQNSTRLVAMITRWSAERVLRIQYNSCNAERER